MAQADGASKGSPGLRWGLGSYQGLTHKLATLFAMTAGSANATQFPMMVIAYGGVPFLLACFAFLLFVAFPAMRLESNLAQFVGDGNRGIFSTVPLFFGIGYAVTTYVVSHVVADTLALADALALLLSLTRSFDWHHDCPGGWMTRNFSCYAIRPGSMWSNALYVSLESVGVTGTIYLGIERFNCFKNRFQEDVIFVLVADTASKGIGTVVSFLFLGHLSYATGINIHMLVHADFNFIVSIPHQAVSLVPFPEFWSRIHSLWLVSMMLPKFLIVPDIIIEVLSVSHPPMIVNRRSTHFSICFVMFCLSIPVVIPGGAKGVAILSNNQNNFRLFLLAFEFIVILQLYGVRRLEIDSQLMTGGVPGYFVKLCWTSVIPLALLQVTQSSSDLLGTHLILTTEAQISPSTSDWRYDSSEENKGEPPVKFRSPPEKVGTSSS
ncbi:hypothetical protein HPB52_002317 [Rhipicephalus sanguineus]|uniref:Uncharacterized protein n=1 Tax=Rhipicephalus sanguineus TaxID=34632 RepID=A0A9D4Q4C9_RHISA|nr:hypothetical protein HPB52_002317 [Rhipicephalus sanguineus]